MPELKKMACFKCSDQANSGTKLWGKKKNFHDDECKRHKIV